jgi:CheY-like chemotaxis protein
MKYSNAKPRGPVEAHACTSAARRRRALFVDSDPVSARLCRETLEGMGFAIERVDSGVAALVAARGRVPDLIVMDFQLRDATAGETIGWLRSNQALKSVPIVVLGISDGSRLPGKDTHAMAGIGKPVSPAAIERTIRDLCG